MSMLFRECVCKSVGVVGYIEAFTHVLSGMKANEAYGYFARVVLISK